MPIRANLYYVHDVPEPSALAGAVGTPTGEAPLPREIAPGRPLSLRVGGVLIELQRFSDADLRGHIDALSRCLAEDYDVRDSTLPARLADARGALTVTIGGGGAPEQHERLLYAMAAATRALVLDEEGLFHDAAGRTIAAPAPEGDQPEAGADEQQPLQRPPPRDRVARRALATVSLAWRAFLEREKPVAAAADVAVANAWLEKHGVLSVMSPGELALLRAPFGSWSEKEIIDGGWCVEAAVVLAWALHLAEVPAHDAQTSAAQIQRQLGLFAPAPAALGAELRSAAEIDDLAARLFAIVSRFRELAASRRPLDFAAFAGSICVGGVDLEGVALSDGDLAVAGRPIASASEPDVLGAQSIAVERFRAVDWLQAGEDEAGEAPPA